MLIIKRKIVLSLIILLIISSSVFGSYWLVKNRQKSSADINLPPDVESTIKARMMAAGAFNEGIEAVVATDQGSIAFKDSVMSAIIDSARNSIFPYLENDCFKQFSSQYSPKNIGNQKTITIAPPNQIGFCVYDLKKNGIVNGYNVNVKYQILNVIVGNFDKVYKFNLTDNLATDNIQIQYESNSQAKYSFGYTKKKKWVKNSPEIQNFYGKANGPYTLSLRGLQSFKAQMINWGEESNYLIDESRSNWTVSTSGYLKGRVKGSWDSNNSKIEELDFCSNQGDCIISLEEKLDLFAEKAQMSPLDDSYGLIESHAYHKETNSGTGIAIRDEKGQLTGKVAWDKLISDKIDNRSWKQTLTFNDNIHVGFQGSQNSTAHIEPITDSITAETKYQKKFSIDEPTLHPNNPTLPNYKTTRKSMNRTDINNNNITRSGDGSSKIELFYANGNSAGTAEDISGVYDNVDELLKITTPTKQAGERIDIWQNVDPKYIQTYFPAGTIYVPGLFTATDSNAKKTVIRTIPYKGVPKNIRLLLSYIPGDPALPPEKLTPIFDLMYQLGQRGAETQTWMTSSRKDFIAKIKQIPDGSLVINMGHGSLIGLTAGKDFITYTEIQEIIKYKQIKISTFAAGSCYAARMPNSIASDIISSFGIGYTEGGDLGNLIGVTDNYWTNSTQDIVKKLEQITGISGCHI